MDITGELDIRISRMFLFHRVDIARSLWVIAASNDQFRIRQDFRHQLECVNHQLKPFVSPPFAKGQNAMVRIAAPGKIRTLGLSSQNAM
jgi:hypothetical protein